MRAVAAREAKEAKEEAKSKVATEKDVKESKKARKKKKFEDLLETLVKDKHFSKESVRDMVVNIMMDHLNSEVKKERKLDDPEDDDKLPDLEDNPKPPPERKPKRPDGDDSDDDDDDEEQSSEAESSDEHTTHSKGEKHSSKGKNKKIMFAVDPESLYRGRVLDFTRKSHKAIYTAATKSLYTDNADRYNLDTANAKNFLQRVQD
jgi:hypothetical protein